MHLGIIMDGNGRWAEARGLPRTMGHRRGAEAVRRTVEAAPSLGIRFLTLYAFSADNWQRPRDEVNALMALFERFLARERARLVENDVCLDIIGRRDRLAPRLLRAIERTERATRDGAALHLRIAIDYSARYAIARAAAECAMPENPTEFLRSLNRSVHSDPEVPLVDLLLRTSGEQRLSDFLLWESAYAELVFMPTLWPDFDRDDLAAAVAEFHSRTRRFGRIPSRAGAVAC